jgi:catechol 2,3-dioxygenase-like lactoylglutathione lyase family enzyme
MWRFAMLDHIEFAVTNIFRARAFYDLALVPLGVTLVKSMGSRPDGVDIALGYGVAGKPFFFVVQGPPLTSFLHVAFSAADRATVDAFYRAALAAGGLDNGAPGLRTIYHAHYYGAFVRDPDGHNIEAVCHAPV